MAAPEVMAQLTLGGLTIPANAVFWAFTGGDSDASTLGTIIAGQTGKSHYITHATLTVANAAGISRLQDEDDTLLFGPVYGADNGVAVLSHDFKRPIKMVANKDLELKAAAAGGASFIVEGFTA